MRCSHRTSRRIANVAVAAFVCTASTPISSSAEDGFTKRLPVPRVRIIEAKLGAAPQDTLLAGDIRPRTRVEVAFRVGGRISQLKIEVGDHVAADQLVAILEPQTRQPDIETAKAALVSAEARLARAELSRERQRKLLSGGFTTRSSYDDAERDLRTAQAAAGAANAQLEIAQEQDDFTELRAAVSGVVTDRLFEVGQVVQAGQTALAIAQDGPRDAVFDIDEPLAFAAPSAVMLEVALKADPQVTARGTVRETSQIVGDPNGRLQLRVGLDATPGTMSLGASVVVRGRFAPRQTIVLPGSALHHYDDRSTVWVYNPRSRTVAIRFIDIDRIGLDTVSVRSGLDPGEQVVIDSVESLRPGRSVDIAVAGDLR
jgi:membrane fusion protein, multidrug efflux system